MNTAVGIAVGVALANSSGPVGPMPPGAGFALAVVFLLTFFAGVLGWVVRKFWHKQKSVYDAAPGEYALGFMLAALILVALTGSVLAVLAAVGWLE